MNTNGTYCATTNLVCRDILIRNENGAYLRSFNRKIGKCSVLYVEFWGALDSFQLAWYVGFRNIILEMNSVLVVQLITKEDHGTNAYVVLVSKIKHLLLKN